MFQVILQSFFLVLAAETGDKTQIVALVLATRFRKPWTVMAGILVATLLNHAIASSLGSWLSTLVSPLMLAWILGLLFIGFGFWILIPDKEEEVGESSHSSVFFTTALTFFLAEMGDKTQLATVALGARFAAPVAVTIGTTIGMMVADGVAVVFGAKILERLPMKRIRLFACLIFICFGVGVIANAYMVPHGS